MDLQVQKREVFGKKVDRLRGAGFLPAELYGSGKENIHISVPLKDFLKVYREAGENMVVNLVLDGEKRPVLIYDLQRDPVSDEIIHVDFYQVRMDEKIKAAVPLVFIGESPAVKEKGGILTKAMHEVEVEALPAEIPHEFEVDLSLLDDLDKSIYVKDLRVPAGVRVMVDPETVIATVKAFVEEVIPAEAPTVEAVKVEAEEKVEERKKEKEVPAAETQAKKEI